MASKAHDKFRGKLLLAKESWESCETLCVDFWKNRKLTSSFSWVRTYSRLTHENVSEKSISTNKMGFLEKLLTQKFYTKTISKTYKILKNLLVFDHQAIEYTHIRFEHVQLHKWNRHSFNIKLVCCVCGSSMN